VAQGKEVGNEDMSTFSCGFWCKHSPDYHEPNACSILDSNISSNFWLLESSGDQLVHYPTI